MRWRRQYPPDVGPDGAGALAFAGAGADTCDETGECDGGAGAGGAGGAGDFPCPQVWPLGPPGPLGAVALAITALPDSERISAAIMTLFI